MHGNSVFRRAALIVFLTALGSLILSDFYSRVSRVPTVQEARNIHSRQKTKAEVQERFQQGVVMLHAKHYEEAITAFHRVIELAPEIPEAHVNMGYALLGLQRYEAARDFFESATVLRPQQINAYYGLAEALEGLHDMPGALGAMRTYLHLAPAEDIYRRKAEAAVWEWSEALRLQKQKQQDDASVPKPKESAAEH